MNSTLSKAFKILRFPLALLVVYIHIDQVPGESFREALIQQNWYMMCNIFIAQVIARLAVPCFFFMSGFLFFTNVDTFTYSVYKSKMIRRIPSLIIPYLIWNVLAALYLFAIGNVKPDQINLEWLFLKPANFPMWFIRDMIMLQICTPVIYLIIHTLKYLSIFILALMYIANMIRDNIAFFAFGTYVGIWKYSQLGCVNIIVKISQYMGGCHRII